MFQFEKHAVIYEAVSPFRKLMGVQIKANKSVEFGTTPVSPENGTPMFSV